MERIKTILRSTRHEAEERWNVSPKKALFFYLVPLAMVVVVGVLRVVDKQYLGQLTDEDGLAEWLQVFFLTAGVLFSFVIASDLARNQHKLHAMMYVFLGLGLFFIAGEELAWGQRIFSFSTPPDLVAINDKSEVSLHNISSVAPLFTFGKLMIGLYGVMGVWVMLWVSRKRDISLFEPFVVPVFLSSSFLIILVQRILRLTIIRDTVPLGYGEIEETFLAYGMAVFVVLMWRRIRLNRDALRQNLAERQISRRTDNPSPLCSQVGVARR